MASPLLEIRDLSVSYGDVVAVHDATLEVEEGWIVALVGANGAGKSTLLKTISGLLQPGRGEVLYDGQDLLRADARHRVGSGIVMVPEGRRLYQTLTVLDNLRLGAYLPAARARYEESLERVFTLFPVLSERANTRAGLLSGGQQQMLAIGRAVMAQPRLMLIDEASLGLSPKLARTIFELIVTLNEQGATILLVEPNVHMALNVAHRAYVMKTGYIVLSGTGQELLANDDVRKAYVGERGSKL